MPSLLSLPPNAAVHQEDAVTGIKTAKPQTFKTLTPPVHTPAEPSKASEFALKTHSVALSFAYDNATKALNVVMTDKHSGEVVRKISYTHLPTGVHQSDKLHGLLLDELA
jgi:FlaG protein